MRASMNENQHETLQAPTGRYEKMDQANHESWYMTEADRPYDVFTSINGAGQIREKIDKSSLNLDFVKARNKAARHLLAGNMSTVRQPDGKVPYGPQAMTDQERYDDALANMSRYFEQIGIDPADVRVLNPERDYSTPLTVVNIDDDPGVYGGGEPVKLQQSGDFIYTYNPNIVMAVRPADCPIVVMSAETPKGHINMMIHFAWRGPASGQFEDMARELDALGVDRDTIRAYITPGGHAETYQFAGYKPDGKNNPEPVEGNLFINVKKNDDESYSFGIDTPNAVYEAVLGLGLDKKQIFIDTSDTTALDSGYSSHSRAMNQLEDNTRDLVAVKFHA
jgi:copper oxidase (laccase) domain-containing protein